MSAQPVQLLHKSFSVKYCYLDSIRGANSLGPNKIAMHDIQSSIEWAKNNNEDDLVVLMQLRQIKLTIDRNNNLTNDSVERELIALLANYGKKSNYLNAEILQNLGFFYYFVLNKNNLSFEHYVQAYNQYKDMDPIDYPGKRSNIYELSGCYFRFGDYHNAIKYLKEALATPQPSCGEDVVSTCYNTIGLSYQALNMYDSALIYFKYCMELAISRKDDIWIGISEGNIGAIYFLQGNIEQAIPVLEKSIELSLAVKQRKNALNSICTLANAYLKLNNTNKAELYIKKADSVLNYYTYLRSYELRSELLRIKARLYSSSGDAKLTYLYADSAMMAMDSVNASKIASNQMKTDDRERYVKQKFDRELIESERQRQLQLRNSLIVSILLLMIIAILIINRQRLVHKKLETDKKNAEAELAMATTKLFSFSQRESEKDELIEQLKREDEQHEDMEARIQLENAILLTDDQWEDFRRQFEKVHRGFFSRMKTKMPELTAAETRFLALTKLNIPTKVMAGMLGVSHNTIRSYKFRIRKKLNLEEDFMMDDLVKEI